MGKPSWLQFSARSRHFLRPKMSNESNVSIPWCQASKEWLDLSLNAKFIAYHIITIIYVISGVLGRLLSLISIHKETKFDRAYLYQIFVLVSEICEILTFTVFVFAIYWWGGFYGMSGEVWFEQCYNCTWFAAYVSTFLSQTFVTCTLLLTLAMTTDRIFCLAKPHIHRGLPHRKIQIAILLLCVVVSIVTSVQFCMLLEITEIDGLYFLAPHRLRGSPMHYAWTEVHNVFKIVATLGLFFSNFLLLGIHRYRMKQKAKIQNRNEKASRSSSTLFKMTLCQSTLTSIGQLALVSYHLGEDHLPDFYVCYFLLWGSIIDSIMELADVLEFYLMLAICQNFRRMVIRALRRIVPFGFAGHPEPTVTARTVKLIRVESVKTTVV